MPGGAWGPSSMQGLLVLVGLMLCRLQAEWVQWCQALHNAYG